MHLKAVRFACVLLVALLASTKAEAADFVYPPTPLPEPLKVHVRRFLDSTQTPDLQCCPIRTLRAYPRAMKYDPSGDQFFTIMGNGYFAYRANAILYGGQSLIRLEDRVDVAGELYLEPAAWYDANVEGSLWHWHTADKQAFLNGFDFDDRGIHYLAYDAQGWGMLQFNGDSFTWLWDSANPANPSSQLCVGDDCSTPVDIYSVKVGATYYAIVGTAGSWAIYNVDTPSSPRFLGVYRTGLRLAVNASGTIIAAADLTATGRLIPVEDFVAGRFTGTPVTLTAGTKYWTVVPDGDDFWFLPYQTSTTHVIHRVTSGGQSSAYPVTIGEAQSFFTGAAGAGFLVGVNQLYSQVSVFGIGAGGLLPLEDLRSNLTVSYYRTAANQGSIGGILPIEWNGKTYMIWNAFKLGDVYEVEPLSLPLSVGSASVSEGDSGSKVASVSVTLSSAGESELTATWRTIAASASSGDDFEPDSGTITFAPGETEKTVMVVVVGDVLDEDDETFKLGVSYPLGNGQTYEFTGTVTIVDDDQAPSLSISDAEVVEGDAGQTLVGLTVQLSVVSGRTVTVAWQASPDGTASAGGDFWAQVDVLTLQPGEASGTINVNVVGDLAEEIDETFSVHLSGATNATIDDGIGIVTILDDDGPPEGINATALTPTSVTVTWNSVAGATGYDVYRLSSGGSFAKIGSTASTAYVDATVSRESAYLYAVRAVDDDKNVSGFSVPDLATTVIFTDPTITPGLTKAKATHVTELRTAVNAVRALAGLGSSSFTDPTLTASTIAALHVTELREALDEARTALGIGAASRTDPTIVAGSTTIKAAHVMELRSGVQ